MSIDLTIPGDVSGIRRVADWLAPRLTDAIINSDLELVSISSDSQHYWTGLSGNAFRSVVREVRAPFTPVAPYLGDAAAAFRAYANRLERGREDFATMRGRAPLPLTWRNSRSTNNGWIPTIGSRPTWERGGASSRAGSLKTSCRSL